MDAAVRKTGEEGAFGVTEAPRLGASACSPAPEK